jgi:hypothetical protein
MIERSLGFAVWMVIGFFAFGVTTAQAYLDPGTGSMILQAIIGAVAGALIVIKLYWYKLTNFFKGRAGAKTESHRMDKGGDKGGR